LEGHVSGPVDLDAFRDFERAAHDRIARTTMTPSRR
jgi:hypothetical protein